MRLLTRPYWGLLLADSSSTSTFGLRCYQLSCVCKTLSSPHDSRLPRT